MSRFSVAAEGLFCVSNAHSVNNAPHGDNITVTDSERERVGCMHALLSVAPTDRAGNVTVPTITQRFLHRDCYPLTGELLEVCYDCFAKVLR